MEAVAFSATLAVIMFVTSIFLIAFGNKPKEKEKKSLPQIIVGWVMFAISIITLITCFIVYIYLAGGITGAFIFTILSPLFILAGFLVCLICGISSIVEGFKKDKDGKINGAVLTRGWVLLFLSVAMVATIITTLAILFNDYSNSRGDTPVAFM